jgi:S1-C subfamily serine protease
MSDVTPEAAEAYGLNVTSGALVMDVNPGSGADDAGIQVNDVIVAVDGTPIASGNELRNMIGLKRPGEDVEIEIIRDDRRMTLTATLGEQTSTAALIDEDRGDEPLFEGVELEAGQQGGIAGLVVVAVAEGSIAAAQGLREGDLMTSINRQRVRTLAEARAVVANSRLVMVEIRRGNRNFLIRLR